MADTMRERIANGERHETNVEEVAKRLAYQDADLPLGQDEWWWALKPEWRDEYRRRADKLVS
jgi:hypothetical protein